MRVLATSPDGSRGGGNGEEPITLPKWIAGLSADSSSEFRDALKKQYVPETKQINGLLSVQENLAQVDKEIADLEAQLAKLKEKRTELTKLLKANKTSSAEATDADAAKNA